MIGVASPSFCFVPFPEMVGEVAERFDLWEILVEGRHSFETCYDEISDAVASHDIEFQAHAPMTDVNLGSMYEPMRRASVAEVRNTIEACGRLGISLVTVHPGFVQGIAFLRKSVICEQTRRSLVELACVAEDNGVVLAVENMPTGINATCTSAEELLEAVKGTSLGLCFDMGHANTAGQIDEMLEHVALFRNVHLHNNDGTWDQHNAIDEGTADLPAAVARIRHGGYAGSYVIEATDLDSAVGSKQMLERLLV
ncbi:MAG: sugar phosphate isomerase/epimerase [Methanobacteriota archaeon]|nr:MAG: sugar phosphate isomerase/epimerase [Euryarchaeota archaeon]